MLIGRVIGTIVASEKHESHEELKLLTIAPLELDGSQRGDTPFVAADAVGAGVGDRVLITLDGYGAMSAVVGIIDEIQLTDNP